MKKNWKGFTAGFVTCLLLVSLVSGVQAATADQNIQAILSYSMNLKLNGQDWAPKDSSTGQAFAPIVFNGRTYLPVKAVVQEAAGMALEYDAATKTVWIGGKTGVTAIRDEIFYRNDFGSMITSDKSKLTTPDASYAWGIVNDRAMSLQHFIFYLEPEGKYNTFTASFYLDGGAKDSLTINIRENTTDGPVIKTLQLEPGVTQQEVSVDIRGRQRICVESTVTMKHDMISQLVIGEPVFK
ncbi:MAG: hypothetical protein SCK57_11570 [Bacillota bacterium]|nr:hypothetical protein [Bacillota bacterium]MDW7678289.1 hypothetical protein [Bacillota bacterium]